jgi:hypothetical protein
MSAAKRILALPLVLLALMVQGFIPAAAAAMTARMADPFASLPICSADLNGGGGEQPGAPFDHQRLCDACQVCSASIAIVRSEAPSITPPVVTHTAALPAAESVGPRGPPRLAPRARGPPTLS